MLQFTQGGVAKFEEEDKTATLGRLHIELKWEGKGGLNNSLGQLFIIYPSGRDGFYGWMGFGGSGKSQNIKLFTKT